DAADISAELQLVFRGDFADALGDVVIPIQVVPGDSGQVRVGDIRGRGSPGETRLHSGIDILSGFYVRVDSRQVAESRAAHIRWVDGMGLGARLVHADHGFAD